MVATIQTAAPKDDSVPRQLPPLLGSSSILCSPIPVVAGPVTGATCHRKVTPINMNRQNEAFCQPIPLGCLCVPSSLLSAVSSRRGLPWGLVMHDRTTGGSPCCIRPRQCYSHHYLETSSWGVALCVDPTHLCACLGQVDTDMQSSAVREHLNPLSCTSLCFCSFACVSDQRPDLRPSPPPSSSSKVTHGIRSWGARVVSRMLGGWNFVPEARI